MTSIPKIPKISEDQITPLTSELIEIIHLQQEVIQQLKDGIARLKGQKGRPVIKPSALEKPASEHDENKKNPDSGKRPGSAKRKKTEELDIHETRAIRPDSVPEGSTFKGYQDYVVQDIVIRTHNIRYRLERWETADGQCVTGKVPGEISGHFGPTLVSYILHQYHHAHVTQPLILEELREFGIDISSGQLSRIITEGKEPFHEEKKEILPAGLGVSEYVNTDDTGARHNGKNGCCTHIGNEFFAWFESTGSKSRINFLELLSAGSVSYIINEDALDYMSAHKLAVTQMKKFSGLLNTGFDTEDEWKSCLAALGITDERHIRTATEGALFANVIENGLNPDMVIVSDDAGQFNVFLHALCRIHAERSVVKLVGFSEEQRQAIEDKRSEIWNFYGDLKDYKKSPCEEKKEELEKRFDEIFKGDTCFASLNQTLKRIHKNKPELLVVLDRPDIPLHNSLSENDIREYVKKRKISGSTRSEEGRRCRDTFASLKKTCRKLGISFWEFLKSRITGKTEIPFLP
ncbi:MAG: transposase, partial [Delftia sp.]|nr:transposase [Delftia sp.]